MKNTFYAMLSRMKYIHRWGLMRSTAPENLSEHTLEVAYLAHALVELGLSLIHISYEVIKRTGRFSLSILSEETNPNVIAVFGFSSSREKDKYERFDYDVKDGLPYLRENTCGSLTCQVLSMTDMETHTVVFARLVDTAQGEKYAPMTYSYYHKVVKGKAPKNAPTYQAPAPKEAAPAKKERWVCQVCGYVYEGDLTHLILRKTFPQLTELMDRSTEIYRRAYKKARFNESKHVWTCLLYTSRCV